MGEIKIPAVKWPVFFWMALLKILNNFPAMKIFPAQIMEEIFIYHSSVSEQEFKKQVMDLFNKTGRFRHPPDLDGKFLDEKSFQIVKRWSLPSFMKFPFYNSTSLKVLFLEDSTKQTQVTITAVPFTLYPTLFVLLPLVYLYFFNCNACRDEGHCVLSCFFIPFCFNPRSAHVSQLLYKEDLA